MSKVDPTSPDTSRISATEYELTVDDVAELQATEAAALESDSPEIRAADDVPLPATNRAAPLNVSQIPHAPIPQPLTPSIPPLQIAKRAVSGRYRSTGQPFQLELRVDVDGKRPMKRVSGDFFKLSGATLSYFGSFIVDAPIVVVTPSTITIEGTANHTYVTGFPKLRIKIPRTSIIAPAAPASVQFLSAANVPGATYACPFQSIYFRTVQYEQDRVASATLFTNYHTGTFPSGGPARDLTVVKSYAEAGIEFQTSGATNVVPIGAVGSAWSNAELHSAMQNHFSLWGDTPQWKVWLFAATVSELGSNIRGIMFDQQGKQRQGCAVFHDIIGGNAPDAQRAALRTYVHELGHCFNLLHSFQKSFATPPIPDRPAAKSWMNYVQNYPGGAAAYWADFPFQFDDPEIVHLRHGYRDNVITGGSNFGIGAALIDPRMFADTLEDNSGMKLELDATRRSFANGEPVVVKLKLTTNGPGKPAHTFLHPNMSFVQIGIRQPSGNVTVYEPLIHHCVGDETLTLDAGTPTLEESAYIGYGKGGFYFDQVGNYEVRALYYAPDGSQVLSNVATLRVRHPVTAAEEELADLFLGDDQGQLLYLLGSDSKYLQRGNDAFDLVIDKYGKNPLADYARLAKGINAGREFKTITAESEVEVREPHLEESIKLLSAIVEADDPSAPVDAITREMVANRLALTQDAAGDDKGAKETRKRLAQKVHKLGKAARAGMY